ncbi:hypothetical protein ACHAPU_001570 [Fusarium lateritium]
MSSRDRNIKPEPAPDPQTERSTSAPSSNTQSAAVDNDTHFVKHEGLAFIDLDPAPEPRQLRVKIEMESNDHQATTSGSRVTTASTESRDSTLILDYFRTIRNRLNNIESTLQTHAAGPTQESSSSEIAKLKETVKKKKESNRVLLNKLKNLFGRFNQQNEELQAANEKLDHALRERDEQRQLLDGGALANATKTTDSTILGKWDQLAYNIRSLAHLVAHEPDIKSLDEIVIQRLRLITPHYVKILKDEEYCNALMQAYIWNTLWEDVFKCALPIWGGPEMCQLKDVRQSVISRLSQQEPTPERAASLAHAAQWFSQGSTMFCELWEDDPTIVKDFVKDETRNFMPFLPPRQTRANRTDKKVNEQLRDIVRAAIELEKMMLFSKAIWDIRMVRSRVFTEKYMESYRDENQPSSKARVRFVISPLLIKTGTADGQNYDHTIILSKSIVVCD